jgi:hypothetical protein
MMRLTHEPKLLTKYDIGRLNPRHCVTCRPVQVGERLMLANATY